MTKRYAAQGHDVLRNLKTLLVVVAGLVSLLVAPLSGRAEARPVFSLGQSSYDFGTVPQGTMIVYEFDVKNSGTADLVIQRIAPSCGCTAAQVASSLVKPGASEKVRVSFDTSGFFGRKKKTVNVLTNDPQNPEKIFTLTGVIVTGYSFEPAKLDFGEVHPASPLSDRLREVTFSVAEGVDLKITKVVSLSKSLLISPVRVEGRKATVTVELLSSAPQGPFRDRVIFEIDGGRQATVNVPVTANISGDLRMSASTVSFGVIEGREVIERRVQFENMGVLPITVQSITSSDPAVTASFVQVQPGRQGVIVVRLDPAHVQGDLRATLALQTSHPSESPLSLNVFGVLAPK